MSLITQLIEEISETSLNIPSILKYIRQVSLEDDINILINALEKQQTHIQFNSIKELYGIGDMVINAKQLKVGDTVFIVENYSILNKNRFQNRISCNVVENLVESERKGETYMTAYFDCSEYIQLNLINFNKWINTPILGIEFQIDKDGGNIHKYTEDNPNNGFLCYLKLNSI